MVLLKENRLKGGDVEGKGYIIYFGRSFCFSNLKKGGRKWEVNGRI